MGVCVERSEVSTTESDREGRASPIDTHVGARIRLRRTLLGMSQEKLGDALGLTFQQVQKYERGINRVGASRLYDLSRVLDVPIAFFFDDMSEKLLAERSEVLPSPRRTGGFSESQDSFAEDLMTRRETIELVRAYYGITDQATRKQVIELLKRWGSGGIR